MLETIPMIEQVNVSDRAGNEIFTPTNPAIVRLEGPIADNLQAQGYETKCVAKVGNLIAGTTHEVLNIKKPIRIDSFAFWTDFSADTLGFTFALWNRLNIATALVCPATGAAGRGRINPVDLNAFGDFYPFKLAKFDTTGNKYLITLQEAFTCAGGVQITLANTGAVDKNASMQIVYTELK